MAAPGRPKSKALKERGSGTEIEKKPVTRQQRDRERKREREKDRQEREAVVIFV